MNGPQTSMSLLTRNLFYLYEELRDPRSLPKKNLFYLYAGPKDLHELLNKEFVLPI